MTSRSRQGRGLVVLLLAAVALAAAGCGSSEESTATGEETGRTTTIVGSRTEPQIPPLPEKEPGDLVVEDLRPGWGVEARQGDLLTTRFVGVEIDGEPYESTWDPGHTPFSFHLGSGESNPAWEKGLPGMRVGGRRELIVPSREVPWPPYESLVFVVELIGVKPPELDDRTKPDVVVPPGEPPKQLKARDLIEGSGPRIKSGDVVTMNYVSRYYTGRLFSNSWDDGHPFRIRFGADSFKSIPGWEEGLRGMRVGGRRELIVPPDWIFQTGAPADSEPSETLVYIVDMLGITEPRAGAGRRSD
jgi:FKBP-type peptidyl-prolyl cis-trans isomerase